MKKIFKTRIFTFILGFVVAGGIGVYAASQILASDISYKDGTVESALNDLYSKANNSIYYVGELNSTVTDNGATTSTFDIKNIYDDYGDLTIDNFVFKISETLNHWCKNLGITGGSNTLSESYDSSTGILTIVNAYGAPDFRTGIKGTVYLIPNISSIGQSN